MLVERLIMRKPSRKHYNKYINLFSQADLGSDLECRISTNEFFMEL